MSTSACLVCNVGTLVPESQYREFTNAQDPGAISAPT